MQTLGTLSMTLKGKTAGLLPSPPFAITFQADEEPACSALPQPFQVPFQNQNKEGSLCPFFLFVSSGEEPEALPTASSLESHPALPGLDSVESSGQRKLVCCFPGALGGKKHPIPKWCSPCAVMPGSTGLHSRRGPSQTDSAHPVPSCSYLLTCLTGPSDSSSSSCALSWEPLWGFSLLVPCTLFLNLVFCSAFIFFQTVLSIH